MSGEGAFGHIPASEALSEASPESLAELLAREPEGLATQSLEKIIAAVRAQRERYVRAESLKREAKSTKSTPKTAMAKLLQAKPAAGGGDNSEDVGF